MTIKELMKKYGDGKYIIETQENIYMGSYGMMGYTLYTHYITWKRNTSKQDRICTECKWKGVSV